MRLYVKNMVCHRCKMVVVAELEKLGLHPVHVELGEVLIEEKTLDAGQLSHLAKAFEAVGFELIDDRRSKMIEQIKTFVINAVHYEDEPSRENFSHRIARHLHHDYSYLSNLFSDTEGITIEQYIINQKIERVKELLRYGQSTLSQIADQLGYSSVAHLSNQFKKLTGLTPSQFRQSDAGTRKALDRLTKR